MVYIPDSLFWHSLLEFSPASGERRESFGRIHQRKQRCWFRIRVGTAGKWGLLDFPAWQRCIPSSAAPYETWDMRRDPFSTKPISLRHRKVVYTYRIREQGVGTRAAKEIAADLFVLPCQICHAGAHCLWTHHLLGRNV